MTDRDSALPPEQDRAVRRLLAEARHDEPMPPQVAARLDRVLADLAAPGGEPATVTPLVRRRRRAAGLLVAAAAVVAVGVGIGQGQPFSGQGGAESAADGSADRRTSMQEDAGAGDSRSTSPDAEGSASEPQEADELTAGSGDGPVRVRKRHFARDAQLVQGYATDRSSASFDQDDALRASCRSGDWGAGTFVPARYGSDPAVLVLRRPAGDTQVAELFVCGRSEPVRAVRLPAP